MRACPKCKNKEITETIYGLICEPDEELNKALKDGKVRLGGCVICEDSKRFRCNECLFEWGNVR